MSSRNERQPWLLRFLDTFLQEQSIKWMLAVGMLILLGSSLMLVSSHWNSYTAVWKLLVLVGYTAGLHVAGQFTWRSLGLRRTGTGLMALTVLLIPLPFYALRLVDPELGSSLEAWGHDAGVAGILCLSTLFALVASGQIFRHFLKRPEYVFTAAYVTLSVAGAVIPALPAAAAPFVALALWTVFAIGSMRVNRHICWLVADHRWPRVCAFFPILLLGGQFLILFASSLAPSVPLEWLGFGIVLTSIPILFAADHQARVIRESANETKQSFTWNTALPLFAGLVLTAAGVCLAATEFPRGVGLVPTASVAAVIMYFAARRTDRTAFVWPMLILATIAYQSSPVFFREFATHIVQQSAQAVQESRLPIAFYGLTYLPLLLTFSIWSAVRRRSDDDILAVPIRRFSVAVGGILLLASLQHMKAVFPVGVALSGLFGLQSLLFRSRPAVWLVVVASIMAAAGFTPFAEDVLELTPSTELSHLAFAVVATVLCLPGRWLDGRAATWRPAENEADSPTLTLPVSQSGGLLVLVISMAVWLGIAVWNTGVTEAPLTGVALAALLMIQAVHWRKPWLSDIALMSLIACPVILLFTTGTVASVTINAAVGMLTALWLLAQVLHRLRQFAVADTFAESADRVVLGGFACVAALALAPGWYMTLTTGAQFDVLMPSILVTAWALFDAARRRTGILAQLLSSASWVGLLATVGVIVVERFGLEARVWLPAVGASLAGFMIPILRCCSSALGSVDDAINGRSASVALSSCVLMTLGLTTVASLVLFSTPMRVAGLVSLGGLILLASLCRHVSMRTVALMLVNWQLLCAVIQAYAPNMDSLADLTVTAFAPTAIPFALLAALQALSWSWPRRKRDDTADESELVIIQRCTLGAAAIVSLICSLTRIPDGLHISEVFLAGGVFVTLAADRVLAGLRSSRGFDVEHEPEWKPIPGTGQVWLGIIALAVGFGYLVLFDAISFQRGFGKFAVLLLAIVAWGVATLAGRSRTAAFLQKPLATTAMWLPAATVLMGVWRHVSGPAPVWLGMNSLALLLAGGFYFWRGLEEHRRGLLVSSAAIVNVALALLWDELRWSDPQFFMIPLGASILGLVELLRTDIPERFHNPLRYAGALTILVSPTFHIVGGSWLHLLTLMVAAVAITLLAIGLRVRALMYAGTAFLVADVIAMVVRGSIDNPGLLWLAGIGIGTLVIGLAAVCERHREQLQQRIRLITAELEAWQ